MIGRRCSSTDDFDINLDDDVAPGSAPCPPTDGGTYQPKNPLSAFNGEDSGGTWTLNVYDHGGGDIGQLDSWSLEICIEVAAIFADGFESGNTNDWSTTVGGIP